MKRASTGLGSSRSPDRKYEITKLERREVVRNTKATRESWPAVVPWFSWNIDTTVV